MTAAAFVAMTNLAAAQGGVTTAKPGQGGSVIQGSAGTSGSKAPEGLERCDKPMGAVAVVEPQQEVVNALLRYKLQSPVGLIRMMIQQSNCFIVVERGAGMNNAMQERQLAQAGQTRAGSNMGGGQIVTADFILTPNVVFAEGNAGGVGGGLASRLGGGIGAIAGGLKFKEAQTSMLVADARTTVQVAAAEGSTKKADLRLGAGLWGGGFGAAAGGYGNTNEGKIIAAALMDNYNNIVGVIKGDANLQRNVGSLAQEAAAGGAKAANGTFAQGDVLGPKIAGVKLMATPDDAGKVAGTLARTDEVVVIGEEKNGFVNVQGSSASGWVKIVLVTKR
jgi:hypothetical protein